MVITEGEGTIVGDEIVTKENNKKQVRVYVHFWPKTGTHAVALEMDAEAYKALYELRRTALQYPFPTMILHVKRGSVVFTNEATTPPERLALVDLNVIARIRTMAEGTAYEDKALGFITDAEGDTLTLVQIAEALAEKLNAGPEQTAAAPS